MNRPIGIFDSGVGGLTVLKKMAAALPCENYIYFGDTARVPYGEKTPEQLLQFGVEILNWFKSKNTKAVLMACNTSSAVTLDLVKDRYDFPIFGLIQPTARYIAESDLKNVGIIATSATIRSNAYSKAILNLNNNKNVFEMACPGLVEIVESGNINAKEAENLVKKYIQPLLEQNAEKIVLGCTHYPFLAQVINRITSRNDILIDPADYLVQVVVNELKKQKLINETDSGSRNYYVSANPDQFAQVGHMFYPDCTNAKEIDLNLIGIN
jgi:glutamate racemase